MNSSSIGERIKYIRKLHKLSQVTFSEELGISQGNLSEIESGKIKPSLEMIINLAFTYKLDLNWLVLNSMAKSSVLEEDEFLLIEAYRQLEQDAKEEVIDFLELKLKRYKRQE